MSSTSTNTTSSSRVTTKVLPVRSIKICCWLLCLTSLLWSCTQEPETKAMTCCGSTARQVPASSLTLRTSEGLVYCKGVPFTGVSVAYYAGGVVAEKVSFVMGKRQGVRQKWFEDGSLSYVAFYKRNRLHGLSRTWWANGRLRSESQYEEGTAQGLQRQWYSSGALFKELHLNQGKEEGLQRAWRENGKLFVNYEAKEGRIYGLRRANLCFELSDQQIVYND